MNILESLTARVPKNLKERVRKTAAARHVTVSDVVREALELAMPGKTAEDPILAGRFRSSIPGVKVKDGSRNYRKHLHDGRRP